MPLLGPPKLFCLIVLISKNSNSTLPNSTLYTLVKTIYDDNWRDKFGDDTNNAIRRVIAHGQQIFKWPTLKTKIFLNVSSDFQYVSERWSANDDL